MFSTPRWLNATNAPFTGGVQVKVPHSEPASEPAALSAVVGGDDDE